MAVSREDIALLVAGFMRAFPAHMSPERVAAWLGNMHVVGNALRLDPGDVEFAIQGFLDDLHAEHAEEPFLGEALEDDRQWAARMFGTEAEERDGIVWDGSLPEDWDECPTDDADQEMLLHDCGEEVVAASASDIPRCDSETALDSEFTDPVAIAATEREIATTGFVCEVSGHDWTTLAIVRDRFSYVRSIKENSPTKSGSVTLVPLFPGAVAAESMETYESMTAPFLKDYGACGWHQAQQMARTQDAIPFLKGLPKEIVIDFPAIRARGKEGEYGVLRMKRDARGTWKLCFEWIHVAEYRRKMALFSESIRIAAFKSRF